MLDVRFRNGRRLGKVEEGFASTLTPGTARMAAPGLAAVIRAAGVQVGASHLMLLNREDPAVMAMLPVAEEYKKILLVEPAVADSITGDKWNRYIFRTGRNSSQDALAAAAALDKQNIVIGTPQSRCREMHQS